MKLSEHFSSGELTCRCGCGFCEVDRALLETAEAIREMLKRPMIVHCGCRCKRHNAVVGGAPKSKHLSGQAMDFHVEGVTPEVLYARIKEWYKLGFLPKLGGLGLYRWGVHIDTARVGKLREWDYRRR